jgi:phosphatidylglycerol:prolipoprotein diacylglycerol transferase
MKDKLITLGPITIHGYGLMIAIGIIAAYLAAEYRAKKMNLNHNLIIDLTFWGLIGGLIGAKLLYFITEINSILANPKILLDIKNGLVIYGGIIGGCFSGYLFCRKHKLNFLKYFDLAMPSIALAQGFGRIGCFLAGCCYGIKTNSPFGIVFHQSLYAPNNIRLIPTQLISSGLNFLHFFVLIFLAKKVKADGQITGLYFIFLGIGRFIVEFYRGDLERGHIGNLSTSQFISIFFVMFGCAIFFLKGYFKGRHKQKTDRLP